MITSAYWINPYGKILSNGSDTHIQIIINNPEKFGLTKDKIQQIYNKYNEPMGKEGFAREEIIKNVAQKGFIRIRLYKNNYWSVTLYDFNKKAKKSLSVWAEKEKDNKLSGPYMNVKILDIKTDRMYNNYNVQDLYFEKHFNESINPMFVESVDEFEDIKILNFSEWLGVQR